jgi:UDP-glucose 4-epimerase
VSSRLLVTGGTGFVGGALLRHLHQADRRTLVTAVRTENANLPSGIRAVGITDLDEDTDWSDALAGVDAVVHAAARVHVMNDSAVDPLSEFRKANVAGSLRLAREAAGAGVRRFVFLSSVKVNGERTSLEKAFRETDPARPEDAYAQSKAEAEAGLRQVGQETGMEISIIRLPLVYGPGVKGNFSSLVRLADTPYPLPFGKINNLRSLLYIGNLVNFIQCVIDHPRAADQAFLVSDGEDLSTTELIRRLRLAVGRTPRLVPVPASVFRFVGRMTGKFAQVDRLCGSLRVDQGKAQKILGWVPPFTVDQGLSLTVGHLRGQ